MTDGVRDPERTQVLADCGLDVTICIAAVTVPDGHIVTVSDRMLSNNDVVQAADQGTLKTRSITKHWGLMFSGDSSRFLPMVLRSQALLEKDTAYDSASIQSVVSQVYREIFEEEVTIKFLSQFGMTNTTEFRMNGLSQFGESRFNKICDAIDDFDLDIELLGYGFGKDSNSRLFEVKNHGKIINHDLTQYAVIGSGYWMALASLRRRPWVGDLEGTIYRLLEAKFCAETATGVGKSTAVLTMNRDGRIGMMSQGQIEKIKSIWEKTLKEPDPNEALDVIQKSHAVAGIAHGDR